MKNKITFSIILMLLCFNLYAQTNGSSPAVKLDQNAQVRDADGLEYPYAVWYKLFQSGKYGMKLVDKNNPQAPIFVMYELSAQEIERRNERMSKPRESGSFKDGDEFVAFSFRDTENVKFKAEELKGKVIVLNFWFINCPPCRQEIPDLNDLVAAYKDRNDVVFIAIGLDPWADVNEFIKKTPFNYHLVTDGRYYSDKYKVKSYPTHVVVDKTGKVIFNSTGLAVNTIYWVKKSIDTSIGLE
jgi:peroxiredoxin